MKVRFKKKMSIHQKICQEKTDFLKCFIIEIYIKCVSNSSLGFSNFVFVLRCFQPLFQVSELEVSNITTSMAKHYTKIYKKVFVLFLLFR